MPLFLIHRRDAEDVEKAFHLLSFLCDLCASVVRKASLGIMTNLRLDPPEEIVPSRRHLDILAGAKTSRSFPPSAPAVTITRGSASSPYSVMSTKPHLYFNPSSFTGSPRATSLCCSNHLKFSPFSLGSSSDRG